MASQVPPQLIQVSPGMLQFGGARMALLEIEAGFWSIHRQLEALIGQRLTNSVLQQAGANGGASFARAFFSEDIDQRQAEFQACLLAYQAAGFGHFEISEIEWPLGRLVIRARDAFEAWMMRQHGTQSEKAACAYTAGVLVGFINIISGRRDVVCIERACQACGAEACEFELMLASEAEPHEQVVTFNPDPGMSRQINLLEMLFDHMPMGIAIIDRDFILRRCNPTWAAFIGQYTLSMSVDVAPGRNIFDLEPGTEDVLIPLFNRVFDGETIRQDAVRIETGGITSYWDIVLSPLYEKDNVVGLLNVSIDATERVDAEQRLKDTLLRLEESESMLRSVIENAQHFAIYRVQIDPSSPYLGKVVLASPSIKELTGVDDLFNFEQWFANLHPEDLPRVVEANRRAFEEHAPYNQPARFFNHKENRWRWVHTISNPGFDGEGRLTHFDGMVIDLTEQKEAEHALQETLSTLEQRVEERTQEVEQRRKIAESLRDILRMINSNLPLDVMMEKAVQLVLPRLGASAFAQHRFDWEHRQIAHEASYGMPEGYKKGIVVSFDDMQKRGGMDYLQAALQQQPTFGNYGPLPERVEELEQDHTIPEDIKAQRIALRKRYAGSLAVPLIIQGQVYGGMVFYYSTPQEFSDEQVQLAMTFAEQMALAIENARLYQQAAAVAALSERNRLARDLHDAVTQTLFSASLVADVLPKLWERNPELGRLKLEELRQLTRGALSEMRTLLLELRPDTLGDVELGELYRYLINAFTGRTRIPVELSQSGQILIPNEVKEAFYRIAQEALNNIAKHSGATQVNLELNSQADWIEVSIKDDGCGFDPAALTPENLGLKIMVERAEAVHAELEILSAIGAGTQVRMRWQAKKENKQ